MKSNALAALCLVVCVFASCAASPEQETPAPDAVAPRAWTAQTTVGEVVATRPDAARIFDLVGIDYCCGGSAKLGDAAANGIDVGALLQALAVVGSGAEEADSRDWRAADLAELTDHIVARHHVWLRRELPRLHSLTQTVHRVHEASHAELAEILRTVEKIRADVLPHLDEEERHVFPAIVALSRGQRVADVESRLDSMHGDHDELGAQLARLRSLTKGYAVPEDACAKYEDMLARLERLERDMHRHVHLENNILLPRARKLLQ